MTSGGVGWISMLMRFVSAISDSESTATAAADVVATAKKEFDAADAVFYGSVCPCFWPAPPQRAGADDSRSLSRRQRLIHHPFRS